MRQRFDCALAIFVVVNLLCFAQDIEASPDAAVLQLNEAKTRFQSQIAAAQAAVMDALNEQIEKAKTDKRLSIEQRIETVELLNATRNSFVESGILPTVKQLKTAVTSYQRVQRIEEQKVIAAYDAVADAYGNTGDVQAAKAIIEERDQFLRTAGGRPQFFAFPALESKEWKSRENELKIWDLKIGEGDLVATPRTVSVKYIGWLADGTVFDDSTKRSQPTSVPLGKSIQGWQEGLSDMKIGGIRRLYIPAALAYGNQGVEKVIPPNSPLVFVIEVVGVER